MTDPKELLDELDDPASGDLRPVLDRLAVWEAPRPAPQDTQQLIAMLQDEDLLPGPTREVRFHLLLNSLNLVRGQLYVVRQDILAASSLVMALGTILALLVPVGDLHAPDGLVLALVAPLIAAIGISFLYGTGTESVVELELSTPMSQRKILFARMTLIFGFNLMLALAGSLVLAAGGLLGWTAPVNFFALVGIWLAPMSALSALAFFLTVVSGDPLAGSAISLMIWGVQALRIFGEPAGVTVRVPDFFAVDFRPFLWLIAAVLGILGIWTAGRDGHHLRRQ